MLLSETSLLSSIQPWLLLVCEEISTELWCAMGMVAFQIENKGVNSE